MNSALITKVAPLRLKAAGEDGTFEGYGSIFNTVDDVGDITVPGTFAASLRHHADAATQPKLLWQHDPARPIGVWTSMVEDERGLHCKGRLLLDVQQAREAHALMKAGALDGLSIGFECSEIEFARPDDFEAKYGMALPLDYQMPPGAQVRVLKSVDLWEVSVVTFPACRPARVESVKRAPGAMSAHEGAMQKLAEALARRQSLINPLL